jgi:hypothetical protein
MESEIMESAAAACGDELLERVMMQGAGWITGGDGIQSDDVACVFQEGECVECGGADLGEDCFSGWRLEPQHTQCVDTEAVVLKEFVSEAEHEDGV